MIVYKISERIFQCLLNFNVSSLNKNKVFKMFERLSASVFNIKFAKQKKISHLQKYSFSNQRQNKRVTSIKNLN